MSDIATLVRFEDMISDPGDFARRVCGVLGLNYPDRQSELASWEDRVQNSNNAKFVEARTSRAYSRPDHSVRIERWRENLTAQELAQVIPIVSDTAGSFGYRLPDG